MSNLEELLNKLIEKGWKPFGKEYERYAHWCLIYKYKENHGVFSIWQYPTTYRELVSKESGLWQFVCKNGMECGLYISDDRTKNYDAYHNESDDTYSWDDYQYRLIESALCDENKLEQFLLQNIKVEWKND